MNPKRMLSPDGSIPLYLSGNRFREACHIEWSYGRINYIERNKNSFMFLNLDRIHDFFANHRPSTPYYLITNNSDSEVNASYKHFADDPLLVKWYAQNLNFLHPKVLGCPLGIVNYKNGIDLSRCGNPFIIDKIRAENNIKQKLIYSNFSLRTNPVARGKCLEITKAPPQVLVNFETYLRDLSKSFFCLAPEGVGIDTHRLWESLYLKTIPVITRNRMVDVGMYEGLPIVILDSWEDFDADFFSE
ncbi:MAG: hypothetical protein H7Y36_11815, partial [Armatimonadetes bacterium]|nr:hypothetical protein [Akkermansiaceae bacterium]